MLAAPREEQAREERCCLLGISLSPVQPSAAWLGNARVRFRGHVAALAASQRLEPGLRGNPERRGLGTSKQFLLYREKKNV